MRFPGFEGEWESCELGEIAELSKGAGISKDQRSSDGNPCILYGELYTTYLTEIIDEVVSKTNLDPTGLVKSKANDIIIPASGETAIDISTARFVLHDDVLLGGDLNIIRLNEQDGKFFSYQLNGVRKKDIARIAHGVSIVHLHGNALSHIVVNYPSRREQEKISSLLSLIDQRIAIQNKVIEKYESLIKALYRQLIPEDADKRAALGTLVQICKGKQLNGEFLSDDGKYYVMNGGIMPSGYYYDYNTPAGTISISEGGNSCGFVQYNEAPFWSGGHCYTLLQTSDERIQYKFLYHVLKSKQEDIMSLRIGSGLPNIQKKDLGSYPVPILPYNYQIAITKILDAVCQHIEIERAIFNGITLQKQYLLQALLI